MRCRRRSSCAARPATRSPSSMCPRAEMEAAHTRWRSRTLAAAIAVLRCRAPSAVRPAARLAPAGTERGAHVIASIAIRGAAHRRPSAVLAGAAARRSRLARGGLSIAGRDRPGWRVATPARLSVHGAPLRRRRGARRVELRAVAVRAGSLRVRVITERQPGRLIGFVGGAGRRRRGCGLDCSALRSRSFARASPSPRSMCCTSRCIRSTPRGSSLVTGLVVLHAALDGVGGPALSTGGGALGGRAERPVDPRMDADRSGRLPALFVDAHRSIRAWEQPPFVPAALLVVFTITAAWRLRRYRAQLAHASQAARLTALFVALALPSLVFYPSLVDAAGRARRLLVEMRYAPEVTNQRRNLQLQLGEAQAQIDALTDLADLISVAEPVTTGPPPTEAAFYVWDRTLLGDARLTSSVELYDASWVAREPVRAEAARVGRRAGRGRKRSCKWEVFEEVSPFFAEERHLLHAGRGICVPGGNGGQQMVGSVVVHVQLDYSNLSFISAQSPYVALLRAPGDADDRTNAARAAGVCRLRLEPSRPVYVGRRRLAAHRAGVRERARHRGAVLGAGARAARPSTRSTSSTTAARSMRSDIRARARFGHLVNLAELVVLAGGDDDAHADGRRVVWRRSRCARRRRAGRCCARCARASIGSCSSRSSSRR